MKLVLKEVKAIFNPKKESFILCAINIESSMLREVWEWCDANNVYFLATQKGLTITNECITLEGEWNEIEKELENILLMKDII